MSTFALSITCIAIGLFGFVLGSYVSHGVFNSKSLNTVMVVLIILVAGVGNVCIFSYDEVLVNDEIISNNSLRAISSDVYVEGCVGGGLFVTSGYINSKPVYSYYYLNSDGFYVQKSIPAESTLIKISNETPCVMHYGDRVRTVYAEFIYCDERYINEYYIIVIPENGLSTEIYLE